MRKRFVVIVRFRETIAPFAPTYARSRAYKTLEKAREFAFNVRTRGFRYTSVDVGKPREHHVPVSQIAHVEILK